jgi:hypothetical protein
MQIIIWSEKKHPRRERRERKREREKRERESVCVCVCVFLCKYSVVFLHYIWSEKHDIKVGWKRPPKIITTSIIISSFMYSKNLENCRGRRRRREKESSTSIYLSIYLIYLLRKMACLLALPTTIYIYIYIYIYQRRQGRILCFLDSL